MGDLEEIRRQLPKTGLSGGIALYGPLLLALYFVATARWGSYLLPGPPYIGDLALGGLIAHRVWLLWRGNAPKPLLSRWIAIPTILLLVLSVVELATGELSITALRDAAPYFYASLVLLGQSYRAIPDRLLEGLAYGSLIFLALWYEAVYLFPSIAQQVWTFGDETVFLFQPRGDFDGALIGVLAVLALDRIVNGRTPASSALVAAGALVVVLSNQSRSALLAVICAFGLLGVRYIVLWRAGRRPEPTPSGLGPLDRLGAKANPLMAVMVMVIVPIGIFATSGPPEALKRSVNVVKNVDEQDTQREADDKPKAGGTGKTTAFYGSNSGVGTFTARAKGWRAAVEWLHEGSPGRAVFGTGFGPHYMQLSGADVLLLGEFADPEVRPIHNFAINTWARLGIVGLLALLFVAVPAIVAAFRLSWRSWQPPPLDLFAGLLVIAIPVTALVGVVLETPFGAIPYFWAVGYLGARMVEEGLWKPLSLPARLARSRASYEKPTPTPTPTPTAGSDPA
ncbi:MAG TPA: O-antigen ligase family protein [Polyangia bacterium]|nr:O-antigen ligase family protein [Polyangia bacterium]